MSAAELSPELRKRIDARLDAIDRVLVRAEVSWSERHSIVGEVETQIFELLARRGEAPTVADVQAVLDSMDPPESYLPPELRDRLAAAPEPVNPGLSFPRYVARVAKHLTATTLTIGAFAIANIIVISILIASAGVIPWLVTLAGLVWLNWVALRWVRSCSIDELRHALAAWLVSKNGAPAT